MCVFRGASASTAVCAISFPKFCTWHLDVISARVSRCWTLKWKIKQDWKGILSEHTNFPKAFFTPDYLGLCWTNVSGGQCWVLRHSCNNVIPDHCCVFGHSCTAITKQCWPQYLPKYSLHRFCSNMFIGHTLHKNMKPRILFLFNNRFEQWDTLLRNNRFQQWELTHVVRRKDRKYPSLALEHEERITTNNYTRSLFYVGLWKGLTVTFKIKQDKTSYTKQKNSKPKGWMLCLNAKGSDSGTEDQTYIVISKKRRCIHKTSQTYARASVSSFV
jgi:hypothetical protein